MRKIRIRYLLLGILLFVILGEITSVSANEVVTSVNGESQGQMKVTGTLGKIETSQSEEVLPNKEKTKPIISTKEPQQNNKKLNPHLPKTGDNQQPLHLLGLLLISGVSLIFFRKSRNKEV